MKAKLCYLTVVMLILVLGVAGCTSAGSLPTPTQTAAPQAIPTNNPNSALVLDMVERLNAGDVDGSLSYFAEDAIVYFVGMPPAGLEIYRGKEQIRPIWEDCVDNHFKWEVEIESSYGDIVTTDAKTWHDFTRQLEVTPNEFIDVYEVKDHKIAIYGSTITEKALAKFKPALAEVMPPSPTSTPSSEPPATEVTVTISDGTCAYNGPMTLQAGDVKVIAEIQDQDKKEFGVTFFTLDPDKDIMDLMASTTRPGPPPWSKMIFFKVLGPNENQTYTFSVTEGKIYLVCWSKPPDLAIGAAGPIEVVP
jgi:ketosteroid isomerase-like protein